VAGKQENQKESCNREVFWGIVPDKKAVKTGISPPTLFSSAGIVPDKSSGEI